MAVIGIYTEPTGRTRVLFDFRAPADGDEQRIAEAMAESRPAMSASEATFAADEAELRRAKRVVPAFR